MSMPVGIVKKTKDNSNKKYREHAEWMQGKKIGRPHQQFHPVANTWGKIMPPKKVTE